MHPIQSLRYIALSEGVSYLLLLFVAMPLKYGLEMPTMVSVVGMIHGLLFVALCIALIWAKLKTSLSWPLGWMVFFASLVPFGAFWADWKLRQAHPEAASVRKAEVTS